MIQHVENLRRTYTKEHAELMELRESVTHSERSFGSHGDRGNHQACPYIHVVLHFCLTVSVKSVIFICLKLPGSHLS